MLPIDPARALAGVEPDDKEASCIIGHHFGPLLHAGQRSNRESRWIPSSNGVPAPIESDSVDVVYVATSILPNEEGSTRTVADAPESVSSGYRALADPSPIRRP